MAGEYPQRPKFFANRFVRVMAKACLANEIGAQACWLLTVIALTEDAKGYRGPVTYFNEQLMPLVGCGSAETLSRVRAKAIEAGWLVYVPGGKGVAGQYWVATPERNRDWDDAPTDEKGTDLLPQICGSNPSATAEATQVKVGGEAKCNGGDKPSATAEHSSYSCPKDTYPPGGGVRAEPDEAPTPGPKPAEVIDYWNSFPGLTPVKAADSYRDRIIRQWATGSAVWAEHWRAVIAYMGRTPFYHGTAGPGAWRASLKWLFEKSNFADLVDKALADGPRLYNPAAGNSLETARRLSDDSSGGLDPRIAANLAKLKEGTHDRKTG